MITQDQAEIVEFLASPRAHGGAAVERVETHASIVFLAERNAWKLKRAVRYDYLDFSTADRRKAMCEAELRINRRTAPDLYRRVVAVTREPDGSLALGGQGVAVDWVLEMARFDQDGLFDRLAGKGTLDLGLMRPLASQVARFHQAAESRGDHGGKSGMAWVIDGNATGFAEQGAGILDEAICATVTSDSRRALERAGALLDARQRDGRVRQCHGDLHLRNIVLIDGHPTLFDAIEFNDKISCTDVLYDLAFLVMDLWRRQLSRHANAVWNGYLAETLDFEGLPLLPLFLSCRAAVRAKTSATAAAMQQDVTRRDELRDLARAYLKMAGDLLHPPGPVLVAIGGLSGSGKSALAAALGPSVGAVPGAVVIRSDEIRKRLCGVDPLQRLGPEGYSSSVTQRVYATMAERAATAVRAGYAAIADAVFARPADRDVIEQAAAATGVPFVGIWLDAPHDVLVARATQRHGDPSDADADVIRRQLAADTGPIVWHRIDGSSALDNVLEQARPLIESRDSSRAI
jgi:aminoglycoside phosphotransferase family enzyme/predicted kinase